MLSVKDLSCVRGDRLLFNGISLDLMPGGLLHVHGGNGSGKSSLLRMLCDLSIPEAGAVRWHGETIHNNNSYRSNVLYLGHANALKQDLSALENLRMTASLAGNRPTADRLISALQAVGLSAFADLPIRSLSQGQQRKVSLARLWLGDSTLWLLDEPFAALDINSIDIVVNRIGQHLTHGGMAVLTTHQQVQINAPTMQELKLPGNQAESQLKNLAAQ